MGGFFLKCPKCGQEDMQGAQFCKNCGTLLKKEKKAIPYLGKVPGFRSAHPLKMIMGSVFYMSVIVILVIPLTLLVVSEDISTSVNSAVYTSQIGETVSTNGQFIIMNISVANNGKGEVTLSPESFTLSGTGFYSTANYLWDYNNTQLGPGENTSMLVVFDVEKPDPEEISYFSLWDPTANISAPIPDIQTIPFNGLYADYRSTVTYKLDSGDETKNETFHVKYKDVNSTHIQETMTVNSSKFYISSTSWISVSGSTNVLDKQFLTNEEGDYGSDCIFPQYRLTSVGDSIDIVDSSGDTIGEKVLDRSDYLVINGKNLQCWVVETTAEGYSRTDYYDISTGLLLKRTETGTVSGSSIKFENEWVLTGTNMPLLPMLE